LNDFGDGVVPNGVEYILGFDLCNCHRKLNVHYLIVNGDVETLFSTIDDATEGGVNYVSDHYNACDDGFLHPRDGYHTVTTWAWHH